MAVLGIVLKAGVPLLFVGGGAVAYLSAPDDAVPVADVWIDSPDDGVLISPGPAFVIAHATAASEVSTLSLEVDGVIASSTSDLEQFDTLVSATLEWDATDGPHQLVVIGGDDRSAPVVVQVGVASQVPSVSLPTQRTVPTADPVTTTTIGSETSTTVVGDTTTTVPPITTTAPATVPLTEPPTTPPTTSVTLPPTEPPTTVLAAPTIGSVTLEPSQGVALRCNGDVVRVTADVTDTTSGQMTIYASSTDQPLESVEGTVSGGVFTAVRDGATPTKIPTSDYYVVITVSGPGGRAEAAAGTFFSSCTKD